MTAKIGDDGSESRDGPRRRDRAVAAKVGSGGGTANFAVSDPSSLDGVGLVVVYSNPALPTRTGRYRRQR